MLPSHAVPKQMTGPPLIAITSARHITGHAEATWGTFDHEFAHGFWFTIVTIVDISVPEVDLRV